MHHSWKRAAAFAVLSASITVGVSAGAGPASAAGLIGVLEPVVLNRQSFIRTSPFFKAPGEVTNPPMRPGDVEGLAYDPVRKSMWIADDSKFRIFEVSYVEADPYSGVLLRSDIIPEKFAAVPQVGNPGVLAGNNRGDDLEALAFLPGPTSAASDDELFVFAGTCCPGVPLNPSNIPTAFRLTRDAAGNFQLRDFQPLEGLAVREFSGAAVRNNEIWLGNRKSLYSYDYHANTLNMSRTVTMPATVSATVPLPFGDLTGVDFSNNGNDLWVTTSEEKIFKLAFNAALNPPTATWVDGHAWDSRAIGITDTRAIEVVQHANGSEAVVLPDSFDFYPTHGEHEFALHVYKVTNSPPRASFTAAPTRIGAGGDVTFDSTSINRPQTLIWDFGDGTTQNVPVQEFLPFVPDVTTPYKPPSIAHTYTTPGVYTVRLTATNENGSSNVATAQITVTSAPGARFAMSPSTGAVPLTVAFDDQSTPAASITSHQWDFGDGTSSSLPDPTHVYTRSGRFTVALTVSNSEGSSTLTKTIDVLGPPTAGFEAQIEEGNPLSVSFSDTSSGFPSADRFEWDFGDGSRGASEGGTSHSYTRGGQYTVTQTAINAYGRTSVSKTVTVIGKGFVGINPIRVLDTRSPNSTGDGRFSGVGRLGAGGVLDLQLGGRFIGEQYIVPPAADAVALNVTAVGPSAGSYITVWPTGSAKPNASNLNFVSGQTIPNMVIVKLGSDPLRSISLFNESGTVDVIVDVLGFFPAGDSFRGIVPARFLDTRSGGETIDGQFQRGGKVVGGSQITVDIAGRGAVPANAGAVALNVTSTGSSVGSYLTVWPSGTRPNASNLNFDAGQTIPNMVIVPLSGAGKINIFTEAGATDVIVDVLGWFPPQAQVPFVLRGISPARLVDTRLGGNTVEGLYTNTGGIGAGATASYKVQGRGGVPSNFNGSVALNVTVVGASSESYLTVWPKGSTQPNASNLNYAAGSTIPNMVIVPIGDNGEISVFNAAGKVDVIVDVLGYLPV